MPSTRGPLGSAFLLVIGIYVAAQHEISRGTVLHPGFSIPMLAASCAVTYYAFKELSSGRVTFSQLRHLGRNIPTLLFIIFSNEYFGPCVTFLVVPIFFEAFYTWDMWFNENAKRVMKALEAEVAQLVLRRGGNLRGGNLQLRSYGDA